MPEPRGEQLHRRRTTAARILLIVLLSIQSLRAQERYFYFDRPYGSEAMFNPISLALNTGYDILQLDGHPRTIQYLPYAPGSENVFRNLGSPFTAISHYGWGNFLSNEVFPITIAKKGAQWWPNYQLHLIGGGMSFVMQKEWFESHNFPAPWLLSFTSLMAAELFNEVVENGTYAGETVDPIADVYIFNWAGVLLFSLPGVPKFFSETLNMADWSLQPSFSFRPLALWNTGQYYSIRWELPFLKRWNLFYYFGMNGLTGLSYRWSSGEGLSVGLGLRAKNRYVVEAGENKQSLNLVWNGGIFYDWDNSLMASLMISGLTENLATLNIYPGIFKFGGFSPGVWWMVSRNGSLSFGVTTVWVPGVAMRAY